jgi:iron only hydrogenase large subunit-like protein
MKACPTKAIRVEERGVAKIEGTCIDCGECIRVCPKGAVKAVTTGTDIWSLSGYAIMSVSPVLYTQFGEDVMPNEVLLALRKVFKLVYDQGYANEICNLATEFYIKEKHKEEEAAWPLISPNCPVVNRLIAYRFPSLLQHLLPIITPFELAARELKERLQLENISESENIRVYSVTPCSAEMIGITQPVAHRVSYLDGALGINEVYRIVKENIRDLDEDIILHRCSGVGMGWGMSGGEIAGLDSGRCLAVSGLQETIRYLEKIEMGLFNDVEYVEFRACPEGCIGGPMTGTDRYLAKHTLQRLSAMFGVKKRVKYGEIQRAYKTGWFFSETAKVLQKDEKRRLSISESIKRQGQLEKILKLLPGKECGACGSPDCRTFAEDVTDGKISLEKCVFAHA